MYDEKFILSLKRVFDINHSCIKHIYFETDFKNGLCIMHISKIIVLNEYFEDSA